MNDYLAVHIGLELMHIQTFRGPSMVVFYKGIPVFYKTATRSCLPRAAAAAAAAAALF